MDLTFSPDLKPLHMDPNILPQFRTLGQGSPPSPLIQEIAQGSFKYIPRVISYFKYIPRLNSSFKYIPRVISSFKYIPRV